VQGEDAGVRWVVRVLLGLLGLALLGVVALFGGAGPIAALPGGLLWGEVREPPDDWSFTDSSAEIQVQTHVGLLPWSVTIWVLSDEGELYLAAGDCNRVWTHRVQADPEIKLRIDGVVYEMQARLETDRALAARLAPIVLHKYMGIAVDSGIWIEGATNGCVFRVEPRS
jgi:hypothetical protein